MLKPVNAFPLFNVLWVFLIIIFFKHLSFIMCGKVFEALLAELVPAAAIFFLISKKNSNVGSSIYLEKI